MTITDTKDIQRIATVRHPGQAENDNRRRTEIKGQYVSKGQYLAHIGTDMASLAQLATATCQWLGRSRKSLAQSTCRDEWAQSRSYDDAIKMLVHGWPEGVTAAQGILSRLERELPLVAVRRKINRPGVVPYGGTMINLPAVLQGRPDTWIQRRDSEELVKGSKIVRLGMATVVSAGVSEDVMMARASAVYALAETLRRYGKQLHVEVMAQFSFKYDTCYVWTALPAGASLDANKLVFALGHPAFARRIAFALAEMTPAAYHDRSNTEGYGDHQHICDVTTSFPAVARSYDILVDSECYVESTTGRQRLQWTNPEHQVRWIMAMLRRQGVITS